MKQYQEAQDGHIEGVSRGSKREGYIRADVAAGKVALIPFDHAAYNDAMEEVNAKDGAISYLSSTDWYVIRQVERAIPVPQDVTAKRLESIEILDV